MRKRRILTISTSGLEKKEGISAIILDYYSGFDRQKFELDIIASGNYSNQLIKEFQDINVNVHFLPSRKYEIIKYIKAFILLIREQKYHAIYIHGSSAIMSLELEIARIYGCKNRIVHSHNTTCKHKILDKLMRPIFYKSYTSALACGVEAGRWLYGKHKFEVIKNGRIIDIYRFDQSKREQMRIHLGLHENICAIGHVGNFNEQKNQKFLIGILNELLSIDCNVKLFLIGDGKYKADVEKMVQEKDLSEYVCFTGAINSVPDMLQAMDVMVLPSLYEGLPLVAVEWQIAGLPCILSDVITKECAYTNIVHFVGLNEGYREWAKKILSCKSENRSSIAEMAVQKTRESGFDLGENIPKLEKYFI